MKKVKIQILLVAALLGNAVLIDGMMSGRVKKGIPGTFLPTGGGSTMRQPRPIPIATSPQPKEPMREGLGVKSNQFSLGKQKSIFDRVAVPGESEDTELGKKLRRSLWSGWQASTSQQRNGFPFASVQKRTIYTPARLKGLYEPLTPEVLEVSPVYGAIEFETGAVGRRYDVQSEAFGPRLVQELFFKQGSQFRPTLNKSKAAYALSPEILGFVIGALETGRLQDQKVRDYIIQQWIDEYRKITSEKRPFSKGKINDLLMLIENEYKHEKGSCRRILLGFLYAKAVPDNDHDMIHYLAGLNEFMPVFVERYHPMAEAVEHYTAQKKGVPSYQDNSFFCSCYL